jgi:arabinan endo-1,5-alpha-L-arabinosidase
VQDGSFYLYCTEDIRNIPIYRSTDLVHWNYVGTAFTAASRPTFEPSGGLWAVAGLEPSNESAVPVFKK